ncbi:DUF4397 domain-containing protein [Pyxidicoccus caerfyrddinensis]|uniref:DUF4397 domain-containing protein n=1 Tax=Pyxidicoccus caerfyrddinensis TaxID=2709663 RepID=UPI0013DC14E2|nr:DUF4397 domain-containing protein [Pyxidicoccus caerfyrddinensis]
MRGWLLAVGLCLAVGGTGCGDDDPKDDAGVDAGRDAGPREDAGRDAGPETDGGCGDGGICPPPTCADGGTPGPDGSCPPPPTCADGGTPGADGGCPPPPSCADGGTPGADGGCPPPTSAVAYVRFVNASLGLKNNPSDSDSAPWRPYALDVYQGGAELFDSVVPGDAAVTEYKTVPAGTALEFTTRNAEAGASAAALATSGSVTLQEGERLTLVAMGFSDRTEPDRVERARLLALKESFDAASAGRARVRFVAADRVTLIPEQGRTRRLGLESAAASPVSTVNPYAADAAGGVSIPATTQRLVISSSGDTGFAPSVSKRLFFTVPAGTLADGSAWFAILTGDDRRPLPDDGQPAMLLVRAGQAQALRLERDPLVYFFNALLPPTPDNDPLVLQALQGTTKVAVGMEFNYSPGIGDLPVTAAGHTLRIARNDDVDATVLASADTGPLQAGGRYLAVVTGRAGQTGALAPRLIVAKDRFADGAADARLRLLNAIPNAPAQGVDFGYFDVANGTDKGSTFTATALGVKYGDLTGPEEGVAFPAPVTTGTSLSYYGLRASGSETALSAAGNAMQRPHFLVLLGDWDTGFLLFLGFNVRENTWSGVAPFDVFQ